MATNIFLGYPPENIKQFIIDNYSKPVDMTKVPLTFTAEEPNVGIEIHSSEDFYPDNIMLETSINNGSTWQPFVIDETKIILNNVGDSVMFRNSSNTIQSMAEGGGERYTTFILTGGKVAASGNIMFLLDKTGELRDLQKAYPKESEEVERELESAAENQPKEEVGEPTDTEDGDEDISLDDEDEISEDGEEEVSEGDEE